MNEQNWKQENQGKTLKKTQLIKLQTGSLQKVAINNACKNWKTAEFMNKWVRNPL